MDIAEPDINEIHEARGHRDTPTLRDVRTKSIRGVITSSSSSSADDEKVDLRGKLNKIRSKAKKQHNNGDHCIVVDVLDYKKPVGKDISLKKMFITPATSTPDNQPKAKREAEPQDVEETLSPFDPDQKEYPRKGGWEVDSSNPTLPSDTSSMDVTKEDVKLTPSQAKSMVMKILDSSTSSGEKMSSDSVSSNEGCPKRDDDDVLMTDQDDDSVKEPEKSKLESTDSDSADKTQDQSVIEVGQANSSITMILHRKKTHHMSSTSPCTLDFSALRVSDDHDKSIVSEGNLSDVVCNIDEYDENSSRPAEKILDLLNTTGNPAELMVDDPDLERLLDDSSATIPNTSTPAASPAREDEISVTDSMPSLVSITPPTTDSGNSTVETDLSSESDKPGIDNVLVQDAVKNNFESGQINYKLNFTNQIMPRLVIPRSEMMSPFPTARCSPPVDGMDKTIFINYLFSSFLNMYCIAIPERASSLCTSFYNFYME